HVLLSLSDDPAPTARYTLSLHDALPISRSAAAWAATARSSPAWWPATRWYWIRPRICKTAAGSSRPATKHNAREGTCQHWSASRSEEHTSELQSRENLVCRLLLEKKK